jgi:peptidoglycan/LPS O-acetylase OafA/YrhL
VVSAAHLHLLFFIPTIAVFAFSIYVFSQQESGIIGRLLLTNLLKNVGLWSYSIYMTHALIVAVTSNSFEYILKWDIDSGLGATSLLINSLVLAFIIIASKYSYNYIEVKFRKISRRMAGKIA